MCDNDPMNEITQKDIDTALDKFLNDFSRCPTVVCPTPTRTFKLNEKVRLGGLEDIVVKEILHDGKAYRLEYTRGKTRDTAAHRDTTCWWWFDINKLDFADKNADNLFAPRLPGQVSSTSMDSLIHQMSHNGIVCDPRYQRGYVWTLADQESLIDSIFSQINIGSIVFSSHSGYLHDGSEEMNTYINLDGDEVQVRNRDDYTSAVIDGQQRLTTIWRFVTNQFAYKGYYWRNLSFSDQGDFNGTILSTRKFNEDDVKYEEVLRMFIKINRGVPQDETHLDKVKKQLAEL